jgi:dTDP-glucose 4,6-dehydratase
MRRIAVTGGAGFIGSHLCDRLVKGGDQVICFDNLLTGRRANVVHLEGSPHFSFHDCDVTGGISLAGSLDAVLHLASPASPIDFARLPLETLMAGTFGTRAALELARKSSARFLFASSSEVYGDPTEHPQHESHLGNVNCIGPRAVYDEGKRVSETFAVTYAVVYGVPVRIARIFNTYGPRMRVDDGRVIPAFVTQALAGAPLTVFGDGSQTRSLCHVDDLVDGLLRLLDSDLTTPVNLGNPEEVTIRELAETIIRTVGSRSAVEYQPLPVDDPKRRRPDIGLAQAQLGWTPRIRFADGLRRILADWPRPAARAVP